jgi:hypothetical protein
MFLDITGRTQLIAQVQHVTRLIETDEKGMAKDKGWTCDLIPKPINAARYYAEEQMIIDQLNVELESSAAKVAELEDEHGGEEGVFAELDEGEQGQPYPAFLLALVALTIL